MHPISSIDSGFKELFVFFVEGIALPLFKQLEVACDSQIPWNKKETLHRVTLALPLLTLEKME